MIEARAALDRLREGNRRFVASLADGGASLRGPRRAALVQEQRPFAIVLGCSDSRVPAEMVFDQSLGDLFVIRVAGNVVASSQIGSVEFCASRFGTRLVVVLGHTQCGAVLAALDELQRPAASQSPHLRSIVDRVRPSVEPLLDTDLRQRPEELVRHAVRANVLASVSRLRYGSQVLEQLVENEGLRIVGAEYSLDSGEVELLDAD